MMTASHLMKSNQNASKIQLNLAKFYPAPFLLNHWGLKCFTSFLQHLNTPILPDQLSWP